MSRKNRLPELKIKIGSLALEAALIHRNERKARRRARVAETQILVIDGISLGHARKRLLGRIHQPKRNTEHPTCSAWADDVAMTRDDLYDFDPPTPRATREQLVARAAEERSVWLSLRDHRKDVVRPIARAALLAYGFLRGRPYSALEARNTYAAPDWHAVRDHAIRFGGPNATIGFGDWVRAGIEHLRSGHDRGRQDPNRLVVPGFAKTAA